jgi:hypothetical protein
VVRLTYTLDPNADFAYDESCTFTVSGQYVTDQDTNDPPDSMLADHRATFQTGRGSTRSADGRCGRTLRRRPR